MKGARLATMGIAVLTVAGLISLYQTLYCFWMTAHPVYSSLEWKQRFYYRAATTVIIGVGWFGAVAWIVKKRRKNRSSDTVAKWQ